MTGPPSDVLPSPLPVPARAGPCVSAMLHQSLQWAPPSRQHLWRRRRWHCAVTSVKQDVSILFSQQCLSMALGLSLTHERQLEQLWPYRDAVLTAGRLQRGAGCRLKGGVAARMADAKASVSLGHILDLAKEACHSVPTLMQQLST